MEIKIDTRRLDEQFEQLREKLPDRPVELPGLKALISGASLAGTCGLIYPSDRYENAIRSNLYENVIRRERLVTEIMALTNVSFHEVIGFHDSSGYSLEFIRDAVLVGAKLDKEDIKRTMEQRTWRPLWAGPDKEDTVGKMWQQGFEVVESDHPFPAEVEGRKHIFIITTPTNDRIRVEAVDCCLDAGCLILEDGEGITVMAVAAGHWVKVEKAEDDPDA